MGSGGNWDFDQTLKAGQVEWPHGPLIDFLTDDVRYVEAWVVQRQTGATASQRYRAQNLGTNLSTWIANHVTPWGTGTFQLGPAVGIALVSWEDTGGAYHCIWWVDQINLVPPPPGP
jgi:hypothetical protein